MSPLQGIGGLNSRLLILVPPPHSRMGILYGRAYCSGSNRRTYTRVANSIPRVPATTILCYLVNAEGHLIRYGQRRTMQFPSWSP